MRVAQGLYENGYITYMRTDSTALSGQAIEAARRQVAELYGSEYLPARARVYASRAKAQEAHEAIRPAGTSFRTPNELRGALDRGLASPLRTDLEADDGVPNEGRQGHQHDRAARDVHSRGRRGPTDRLRPRAAFRRLPARLRRRPGRSADPGRRRGALPAGASPGRRGRGGERRAERPHDPSRRARYTEASLVRELEEQGVGRPSTYAAILQTIVDRGYVWKKGSALVPTFLAFAVTRLLEQHLGDLVDLDFTARMEADLDAIAGGEREAEPWLRNFYFGRAPGPSDAGRQGLQSLVGDGADGIDARAVCSLRLGEDGEGRDVVVRVGRYGPYVQVGRRRRRPAGHPRGQPGARRSHPGTGAFDPRDRVGTERSDRPPSRDRRADLRQEGPLRRLRPDGRAVVGQEGDEGGARGGQTQDRQRVAVDGPGASDRRRSGPVAVLPAGGRPPSRQRRGRYRAGRALRALRPLRQGEPKPGRPRTVGDP